MITVLHIGIILSFFLCFLLITKRKKQLTDIILALWLIVIGIHLLSYSIYSHGYWEKYPHLIGITVPFPFLHGPLLYLYVLYSIKNKSRLLWIDYLHFAPAMISYLYLLPFYFTYSAEEKMQVDSGQSDAFGLFTIILTLGFIISGLTYSILSFRKLVQRKKILDNNFSYSERINLNWLRYSILFIGSTFIVAAIVIILRELLHFSFSFNADLLFYSLIVIFVVYLGYSGIRQQGLFSNSIKDEHELANIAYEKSYKNSGLKNETAIAKHKELLELMKREKPYLNPKLTLNELSQRLHISSNHLSQVINQYEEVNFHDFINKFRVEDFIERAKSNSNFSLLAHALDAGFNSKSSFNNVFKKFKNDTPSAYMSKLK